MSTRPPRYTENDEKRLTAIAVANMAIGVLWIALYLFGRPTWWQLLAAAVFIGFSALLLVDVQRQRAKRTRA